MAAADRVYRLCGTCAERQGGGAAAIEIVSAAACSVCAGMMDGASGMAKLAASVARRYQFRTFAVGVTIPDGVQEREDEMRSDLRLKGNETIKFQYGRIVASETARILKRQIDKRRPDLTLLVDPGARAVSATSRPVYYYGRYTKPRRIPQRRTVCGHCRGSGCQKCRGSGFEKKESVESLLRGKLSGYSGNDKMTFTWLGSEDRESRVLPPGRPFLVELKNPRKRRVPSRFGVRSRGRVVSVSRGRVLPSKPVRLPSFRFRTMIRAVSATSVGPSALAELKSRFRGAEVRFDRPHNRPTVKRVHRVSAKSKGRALLIDAELDGGLPVKRFVSGELVSPSVSEVLKTEVGCRSFDICGVKEIGRFEFAEITRGEAKD